MKKFLLISITSIGIIFSANAQISNSTLKNVAQKATSAATSAGLNVSDISSQLMSKLNPALSLTKEQQPKVLTAVTEFLKGKSEILNLATTNKSKYSSKLGELSNGLLSKLKTVLTASQYTKLLGLKPSTNNATNVLSQLFY